MGTCKQLSGDGAQGPGQMLSLVSKDQGLPLSPDGAGPVSGVKCGRDWIGLAFWKEDFGQGDDSLGWRKWLEPVAFARPETAVVRARAGGRSWGAGRSSRA